LKILNLKLLIDIVILSYQSFLQKGSPLCQGFIQFFLHVDLLAYALEHIQKVVFYFQ